MKAITRITGHLRHTITNSHMTTSIGEDVENTTTGTGKGKPH
jgi:hypothetical protein